MKIFILWEAVSYFIYFARSNPNPFVNILREGLLRAHAWTKFWPTPREEDGPLISLASQVSGSGLVLCGKQGSIRLNERLDRGNGLEQAFPLRAVEGDGEAAKAIGRECAASAFHHTSGLVRLGRSDFHRDRSGQGLSDKLRLHLCKLGFECFVLLCKVREDSHARISVVELRRISTTIAASHGSRRLANHEMLQQCLGTTSVPLWYPSSTPSIPPPGRPTPPL